MAKKTNTTPATNNETVAPATTPAQKKEVKKMKETKKNTTPATSKPATKKATDKKARIEENQLVVYVVKQTITTTGTSTEMVEKKVAIPANVKADQLANLANLVQCKVLNQLKEKYAGELTKAKAMKKDQTQLTDEQKEKIELINTKIKLVNKQMKVYGMNNEKMNVLISEPMAEMLACYITGNQLSLELSNLKACLRFNYQTISSLLDRLLAGETVTTSEEDKEVFTTLRKALKEDMKDYTKDTFYFKAFPLSISLKDIRKWYEVSRLDIADEVFIFDDKKDTTLSKAIVKWFLTKVKVEPKEEPAPAENK